ncbi:hypothetical protein [Pseudidiomarina taiwanensis]|uniref:Uncharacterized protein n=1 Tax=Pseudidiomarina taiwanensis TaxID=337250 RepID=A0A432ZFG9_9GAMM|nr:hypothetical protein [Pseudidiomarina taiwanensis]RUO76725.1 hypothetical protein CWI83_07310 [Pseudidiomarina taiwanensis]
MKRPQPSLNDLLGMYLERYVHVKVFPEEYDYGYDSRAEASDRKQGINPMAQDYTTRVNARREQLGVTPLAEDGTAADNSSKQVAAKLAQELLLKTQDELPSYVGKTLTELDIAKICAADDDCHSTYAEIASAAVAAAQAGQPFADAIREEIIQRFGRNIAEPRTLFTLGDTLAKAVALKLTNAFLPELVPLEN